jgi:hypothetical protein
MPKECMPTRVLEVSVVQHGVHSWEWCIHVGDQVQVSGNARTRMAARLAAYDTMFAMLAGGWV